MVLTFREVGVLTQMAPAVVRAQSAGLEVRRVSGVGNAQSQWRQWCAQLVGSAARAPMARVAVLTQMARAVQRAMLVGSAVCRVSGVGGEHSQLAWQHEH